MSFLRNFYTRLTETESDGGGLSDSGGGTGGGVSNAQLDAAVQAAADAQLAVDQAQDAANAASQAAQDAQAALEEADDDTVNAAQDALIQANADADAAQDALIEANQMLTTANATLSAQNQAALLDKISNADLQQAVIDIQTAQAAVDLAQDNLAGLEEADDDTVNAAQDALIQANTDLANANQTAIATLMATSHDGTPQDDRIETLETTVAGLSMGNVTAADLQQAVDDVEAAQLLVDQAQDALAVAEESDDDTVNAAQDALIAANDTLSQANATLSATNQSAIAALPTTTDLTDAIAAQALAQQAVDDAQDALAVAEEADDDTVNAAQDALITANANLSAANATLAAANQTELGNQAATLQQEIIDRADADSNLQTQIDSLSNASGNFVDNNSDENIAGIKTFTDRTNLSNQTVVSAQGGNTQFTFAGSAGGLNRIEWTQGGVLGASFQATHNNISDSWNMQLGLDGVGLSRLSFNGNNIVSSTRFRVPSTQAGDNGDTATSKDYVDSERIAGDTALQTQIDNIVAGLPVGQTVAQALAADMAALAQEIGDTNTDFAQAFADLIANRTDIDANTAAHAVNASGLTQEIADRQQADIALQSNIDTEEAAREAADTALQTDINTKDGQNVKLTGSQTVTGSKTYTTPQTFNSNVNYGTGGSIAQHQWTAPSGARVLYSIGGAQRGRTNATAAFYEILYDNGTESSALHVKPEGLVVRKDGVDLYTLPVTAPEDGQIPQHSTGGVVEWKYPYGFGLVVQKTQSASTIQSDMSNPDCLVDEIDTTGFVPGLYHFKAVGKFAYTQAAADYSAGLFDSENPATVTDNGEGEALDFIRAEPKDPGLNQDYSLYLDDYVQILPGSTKTIQFRHCSDNFGQTSQISFLKLTAKRVSD